MLETAPKLYSWTRKGLITVIQFHLTSTQPRKQFHFHEESARWHRHCMVKTNMQNALLWKALYWREHLVTCLYYQHVCFKSNQSPKLGFPGSTSGKELTCQCRRQTQVRSLGLEDSLEEGMTTHSNILAWRVSWTEKTDDGSDLACMHTHVYVSLSNMQRDNVIWRAYLNSAW